MDMPFEPYADLSEESPGRGRLRPDGTDLETPSRRERGWREKTSPRQMLVCLCVAAAWRPARPFAITIGVPVNPFVRASRAPRAQFDIDFSAVEYDDKEEEKEKEKASFLKKRAADMAKAREALPTIANMTVADLKTELRNLGQKMNGNKPDLVDRLTRVRRKMAKGLPTSDHEVQRDTDPRWYMLQTANGFEGTVERTLQQAIAVQNLGKDIDRIFVPIQEGETSVRASSVMPSYILIHMRMSRELHTFVTGMQYVVNFVGFDRGGRGYSGHMDGTRGFVWPRPLADAQFEDIVRLTKEAAAQDGSAAQQVGLAQGDRVQVISGPFKGLTGSVFEVGEEDLCTVSLNVMGRETNVQVPVRHCTPVATEPDSIARPVGVNDVGVNDGGGVRKRTAMLADDLAREAERRDVGDSFVAGSANGAKAGMRMSKVMDAAPAEAGVADALEGWQEDAAYDEWQEGEMELPDLDFGSDSTV
jgi:transcriptional antiterminator NusG